ncbi:MAG: RagB/SusD family nutrient uptake outer membrane protein, partial [Dysgonamonadaceae bacterium]|nr:RagB/SusD family nutrient uptake outer membrane protein [Dysgonamonadaceae bacterium]
GANGLPKTGATNTGYYLHKFLFEDINLKAGQSSTFAHAFPLFRYADVFLNYAEAVNELYGPEVVPSELGTTMTALDAINKVRTRTGYLSAAIKPFASGEFTTKDAFRKELRDEYAREFAFEDHRFWDIRRWKIGAETQKDIKRLRIKQVTDPDTGKKSFVYTVEVDVNARVWDDKMYLYPIPQDERDKNKNLTQNPGWEE